MGDKWDVLEGKLGEIPGWGSVWLLEIKLKEPIKPSDIKDILKDIQDRGAPCILCLSGRGPIWMWMSILHKIIHNFKAIAMFDPKIAFNSFLVFSLKIVGGD